MNAPVVPGCGECVAKRSNRPRSVRKLLHQQVTGQVRWMVVVNGWRAGRDQLEIAAGSSVGY